MRSLFWWFCCCTLAAPGTLWAGTLAQFRTTIGEIDVELFDIDKPATVKNFELYIRAGVYADSIFDVWLPGKIVQGGVIYTANRHQTNAVLRNLPSFGEITNEYNVGRTFSNQYGTLAMSRRAGVTNSATSSWFFNLTNNAYLDSVDGGFTVFGKVVSGTNVLNRFNPTSSTNGIYLFDLTPGLDNIPVLVQTDPTYEDLIYVDISLLHVTVAKNLAGEREISWQSVSNQINHVEFTTQIPPVWTELVSTNGTGQLIQVTDPQGTDNHRFYRVRVEN